MVVRQLYNQDTDGLSQFGVGASWVQDAELRASSRRRALGPQ